MWCDALSVTVGLVDIVVVAAIGVCFVYIKVKASREATRLAELDTHKTTENRHFLSNGLSLLRKRFGSSGEVEMTTFENPMQDKSVMNEINKQKRNSRMKQVRKKLSIGARVKRHSRGQSNGGGDSMGGEVKMVSTAADSISVDVTAGSRAEEKL